MEPKIQISRYMWPAGEVAMPVTKAELSPAIAEAMAAHDRLIEVRVWDLNVVHLSSYWPNRVEFPGQPVWGAASYRYLLR